MDTITAEDQYHNRVMAVVTKINDMMHESEVEFDVGVNALITLLASCSKHSELSDKEFLTMLVAQTMHVMDNMSVQTHPVQ